MAASNTNDCFREFIGQRLVGLLFDALPCGRRDLAAGTKTLVFEDGRGLTLSSNGTFWIENVSDVVRAIALRHDELTATQRDIAEVLALAGAFVPESAKSSDAVARTVDQG